MVWEWLNPRLNLRQKNIKENVNLECLSPTLPGLTSPRRMSSTGLLSGSIEVVSGTTSMATIAPTSSAIVHFVEHEVQRGDCLVDISRQHNVELSSLLKANPNLENPDYLWVGNKVRIPYASGNRYSSLARVQMPVKGNCEATVPVLKPLSISSKPETLTLSKILLLLGGMLVRSGEHTVVDGDTLEWLAEKYGTTVSTLKKINNLQGDVIYTGSILKINRTPTLIQQQALMGRNLTARERNSLMEVALINPLQPVEEPTMEIPSFKTYPLLQRVRNLKPPSRLKTVKVQFGDTLADIADEHGLSIRELQRLNNLRNDVIFEDDVLAVSTGPLQRSFLDLRPGQRRTNRLLFSRQIESGGNPSMVGSPKSKSKARGCRERKKGFQGQLDRWLRFRSPLIDGFVSSPFGWRWGAFHEGVDLAADHGTPIFASDRGTVTFAGWSGGYGYLVAIQHEGGFVTRYAHCCAIHSHVGQQVSKGQQVAAVGATGHATGPHLHFEVRRYGEALDPFKWVKL